MDGNGFPNAAKKLKPHERSCLRAVASGHACAAAASRVQRETGVPMTPHQVSLLIRSPRGRIYLAYLESQQERAVVASALLDIAPHLPPKEPIGFDEAAQERRRRSRPSIGLRFRARALARRAAREVAAQPGR